MPKVACPDCGHEMAMRELETQTIAESSGFRTTYRCPSCRAGFDDVSELL